MPARRPKERIVYMGAQTIPINTLNDHPKNPNVGDVDSIRESLRVTGQFRPVLVQKSTDTICAGHHLVKAAKLENWAKIGFVYLDVTDKEALRILIADNQTARNGEIDDNKVAIVLRELGKAEGTGYSEDDFNMLIKAELAGVAEAVAASQAHDAAGEVGTLDGDEQEWSEDDVTDDEKDFENDAFESASEDTAGVYQLKSYKVFEGVGSMSLPKLRRDMMLEKLPDNLVTWAGSATRDLPQEGVTWFYNYGVDSTSGMKDVSKVLLSFFAYDQYFSRWYDYPERYITKMLNSHINMAVMPDFSIETDEAKIVQVYQLYKSYWLARYFQEVGIKIIPNLSWPHNNFEFVKQYSLVGIPAGTPIVAFGAVAFDAAQTPEDFAMLKKCIEYAVEHIKPKIVLFYTNKSALDFIDELELGSVKKHIQMGRMVALSEKAKGREKKTTL